MAYDVVVQGGRTVDGTGTKAYACDVATPAAALSLSATSLVEGKRTIPC